MCGPIRDREDLGVDGIPQVITVGAMAARLGVPLHRVTHVLKTRPHIKPAALAGRIRLFREESVAMVRYELNLVDARRGASPVAELDRGGVE